MDINRILKGEARDENGNEYNGKIKGLQREVGNTENISMYSYQIIVLANLNGISDSKLRLLSGGIATSIFNYEKCYKDLVFPVISGTYFNATDLNINIDLSNKNAGSKISYTVQTKKGECEITVLFVPTIEVGKIMDKYKNSILKYNPRSYLEFDGKKVNNAIRETIINKETNEFALYNNGITMLSDETFINERIGQKNKAQLTVKNPQIINGGQTSFTLSRIYQEYRENNVEAVFQDKEVLLKIITLLGKNDHDSKIGLIEEISTATNQQTPVNNADRISNDKLHMELQNILFDRYGILYERKRGEFADGIFSGYIETSKVIDRNLFFRMYYASNGNIHKADEKKIFINQDLTPDSFKEIEKLDNSFFGYLSFKKIFIINNANQKITKSIYAKVFAFTKIYKPEKIEDYNQVILSNKDVFEIYWPKYIQHAKQNPKYRIEYFSKKHPEKKLKPALHESNWYINHVFINDLKEKFKKFIVDYPNLMLSKS